MESSKRPFNLLYKSDAQLSFVDKLYEIVVGPVRLVVISVMVIIIGAFVYRFSLDSTLNDQVKESQKNGAILSRILNNQEKVFRDTIRRTAEIKKYQQMFKDSEFSNENSMYKLSYVLSELENVKLKLGDEIVVSDYNLTSNNNGIVVTINGGATTFSKVDEFLRDLRSLEMVEDASTSSQTSERGQIPKFSINIKLKS